MLTEDTRVAPGSALHRFNIFAHMVELVDTPALEVGAARRGSSNLSMGIFSTQGPV